MLKAKYDSITNSKTNYSVTTLRKDYNESMIRIWVKYYDYDYFIITQKIKFMVTISVQFTLQI